MLKNIFKRRESEDASLVTLKSLIPKESVISHFKKVYYIGGYRYENQVKDGLRKSVLDNDLKSFLTSIPYNKDDNSMILYCVEVSLGKSYIVSIYESSELYEQNQLIDIVPCASQLISTLTSEVLYPV